MGLFLFMHITNLYKIWKQNPSISTDSRNISQNCMFFALRGDNFNGNLYAADALKNGAAYAIIDDKTLHINTDDRYILVDDVLTTLQKLANFHRKCLNIPVLAITGSNGKTTTKELVRDVLSKKYKTYATIGNLNNHIGVPLTLLSVMDDIEMLVVEMGANHQGEIAMLSEIAEPNFAMITNIGKAHLEGFGGVEGIMKGKSELYIHTAKTNGHIFINTDDAILCSLLPQQSNVIEYAADNLVKIVQEEPCLIFEYESRLVHTKLYGAYNKPNIAFAIAVGRYFDIEIELILDALSAYTPSSNRSQVENIGSTVIIKDAYNANPSSMQLSIESFAKKPGKKIVILGDMLELGEYSHQEHKNVIELVSQLGFDEVLFVGPHFIDAATPFGNYFKDIKEASIYFKALDLENTSILLKGSRGIGVERILDSLR